MGKHIVILALTISFVLSACKSKETAPVILEQEKTIITPEKKVPPQMKSPTAQPRNFKNPRQLIRAYAKPYPVSDLVFSEGQEDYNQALTHYRNKEWQAAFDLFFKMNPKTDQTLMYEASCKIQMGFFLHADQVLRALGEVAKGKTKEHMEWYMALTHYGMGNKPTTLRQLKQIGSQPEHLFSEKALEVLEILSR